MISGLFWPLENTQLALLPISYILPLSMPIRAVQAILIRGRQFNSKDILFAGICITFWTIISFYSLILRLKNKINFII